MFCFFSIFFFKMLARVKHSVYSGNKFKMQKKNCRRLFRLFLLYVYITFFHFFLNFFCLKKVFVRVCNFLYRLLMYFSSLLVCQGVYAWAQAFLHSLISFHRKKVFFIHLLYCNWSSWIMLVMVTCIVLCAEKQL